MRHGVSDCKQGDGGYSPGTPDAVEEFVDVFFARVGTGGR